MSVAVFQLVHTLSYGDAISGEVCALDDFFKKEAIESGIFSVNTHHKLKGRTKSYLKLASCLEKSEAESVLLILHYSLGSPLNELFLSDIDKRVKRAIIYHNLTPSHWFASYNFRVHQDLIQGANELPELLKACDLVLADSSYNAEEIKEYCNPLVLPLLVDIDKWSVSANIGIEALLKSSGKKNFLHVGRVAPNKCIEDVIKIFYFYHHKIDRNSKLWLVGHDIDTEIYSFELRRLIMELQLKEAVSFVGSVADSELKSFYQNSDVYLCMSEHEGFCVPLLEAMHFGLPIIAFNSTAIPETLGDAGLLVEHKEHAELAELCQLLFEEPKLKEELLSRAKLQLEKFSQLQFEKNVKKLILDSVFKDDGEVLEKLKIKSV